MGRRRETREPGVLDVWVVPSREAVKKKRKKKEKKRFFFLTDFLVLRRHFA